MITEMIYTKNTLFVDLKGVINSYEINDLKNKITPVILDYEINKVVIDITNTKKLNRNIFYNFVDSYSSKYNISLLVKDN